MRACFLAFCSAIALSASPASTQVTGSTSSAPAVSGEQQRPAESKQIEPESESHNALKPRAQSTDPKDAPASGAPTGPETGKPGALGKDWPQPPNQPKQN